jgi:CubicO group peptidase (beta-lactamase class C family)
MGLGLVVGSRPGTPIQLAMDDAGIVAHPNSPPFSPDDLAARYGRLPLVHQPGERWMYHNGFDVLAVLVARVAGEPLDAVLRTRIFEPLGMRDTSYAVPESKMDRLAACYQPNLRTGALAIYDDGQVGRPSRSNTPAGGTGLFSTADDFLAFGRMMLRFGRHGAARLLSRASVESMITDQIPAAQKEGSPFFPGFWDSYGWGLGLSVITRRTGPWASPGRFGWEGGLGTTWFSDPREDLVGVLLTQRFGNPLAAVANVDFATLAYQALDD